LVSTTTNTAALDDERDAAIGRRRRKATTTGRARRASFGAVGVEDRTARSVVRTAWWLSRWIKC